MSTPAEMLQSIPLFSLLNAEERTVLGARLKRIELQVGTALFHYGDPGGTMFVLRQGQVELFVKTKTGEKWVLERAGPGDFFGEISLLDDGPRTASAAVIETGEAWIVSREDLQDLFQRKPSAALDMLTAAGRRFRHTAKLLRDTASRNVNAQVSDRQSWIYRAADAVAAYSGSLQFLGVHIVIFTFWILLNVGATPLGGFDHYPFGLLTLLVSLESIILATLLLFSSNRQMERERVRNDIEYEVNLKAEMQIQHLHEKLDTLHSEILQRLSILERHSTRPTSP